MMHTETLSPDQRFVISNKYGNCLIRNLTEIEMDFEFHKENVFELPTIEISNYSFFKVFDHIYASLKKYFSINACIYIDDIAVGIDFNIIANTKEKALEKFYRLGWKVISVEDPKALN